MKILWHSNAPWYCSGYGRQTAIWAQGLKSLGHEVAISAFVGLSGGPQVWNEIPVYPAAGHASSWGMDMVGGNFQHFEADQLITLMDAWTIDPELLTMGIPARKIACWTPVDCEPLGRPDRTVLEVTGVRPIAISRHGERMLGEAGLKPLYVPHGIDTQTFSPPADRKALRQAMGIDDRFVVVINSANQDKVRKAFSEQFQAFARFAQKHDDALLMVNTMWINHEAVGGKGLDLHALAEATGIDKRLQFCDQYAIHQGMVTDDAIANLYGVADVVMNASCGEGFGLPIIEAQACGTPVIVTRTSSMPELCGAGWMVGGQRFWAHFHEAWWMTPNVSELVQALNKAYDRAAGMRKQAREFALQYDIRKVLEEFWVPALAQLAGPEIVPADGLKWLVGDKEEHGDRLGPFHEMSVTPQIIDLIPDGGVFLDVGSHVGHYAVRAAVKASKVIAVEPNPDTASRLRDNLKLNDLKNVTIHQLAAWDKIERLQLESDTGHERYGGTRTRPGGDGTVTGIPLDKVLEPETQIDVVKLDVEGSDLHALRGMRQTLERLRPVLIIEDHSIYGYYKRDELQELLAGFGYDLAEFGNYGTAPYLISRPVAVATAA